MQSDHKPSPITTAREWKEAEHKVNKSFAALCRKKNLDPLSFTPSGIKLEDDFAKHVSWAFQNIYSIPYPRYFAVPYPAGEMDSKIARYFHGIQHTTRAAVDIPVFANLYRQFGDKEALELTDADIHLLQIATLFHDSARQGEAEDLWDNESGTLLYTYLTQVLGVEKGKAKKITEATANKDASVADPKKMGSGQKKYYVLHEDQEGNITWVVSKITPPKNIYQKLIHDADCLDIMRVRDNFDASYLDFYQDYAVHNPEAGNLLAHLLMEKRSIIHAQGDKFRLTDPVKKAQYENENAYQANLTLINNGKTPYPIMQALGNKLLSPEQLKNLKLVDTKKYDKSEGLTVENVRAAIREGKVLARSIATPSAVFEKRSEFFAAKEVYKTLREPDEETRAKDAKKRRGKHGNPVRSTSMLGWGSPTFSDAGFLIIDPDMTDINVVSNVDIGDKGSGFHKKKPLAEKLAKEQGNLNVEQKEGRVKTITRQFEELNKKNQLGGTTDEKIGGGKTASHNEVVMTVKEFHAIYFSKDPNFYNLFSRSAYPAHDLSPVLQAIFLQNEYKKAMLEKVKKAESALKNLEEKKESKEYKLAAEKFEKVKSKPAKLPIFEYSGIDNKLELAPDYTDKQIVAMWVSMCTAYMRNKLDKNIDDEYGSIQSMSLDDIKVASMYKRGKSWVNGEEIKSGDSNYDPSLKKEIDDAVKAEKARILAEYQEKEKKIYDELTPSFKEVATLSLLSNTIDRYKLTSANIADLKNLLSNNEMKSYLQDEKNCEKIKSLILGTQDEYMHVSWDTVVIKHEFKIWEILSFLNNNHLCSKTNIEKIINFYMNPQIKERENLMVILELFKKANMLDAELLNILLDKPEIVSYSTALPPDSPDKTPPTSITKHLIDLFESDLLNKDNFKAILKYGLGFKDTLDYSTRCFAQPVTDFTKEFLKKFLSMVATNNAYEWLTHFLNKKNKDDLIIFFRASNEILPYFIKKGNVAMVKIILDQGGNIHKPFKVMENGREIERAALDLAEWDNEKMRILLKQYYNDSTYNDKVDQLQKKSIELDALQQKNDLEVYTLNWTRYFSQPETLQKEDTIKVFKEFLITVEKYKAFEWLANFLNKKDKDLKIIYHASNEIIPYFVEKGNVELVKMILANGGNVDALFKVKNEYGKLVEKTPLILACEKGDKTMVEVLLQHHANINLPEQKVDEWGLSDNLAPLPLMYALLKSNNDEINKNKIEIVKLLLNTNTFKLDWNAICGDDGPFSITNMSLRQVMQKNFPELLIELENKDKKDMQVPVENKSAPSTKGINQLLFTNENLLSPTTKKHTEIPVAENEPKGIELSKETLQCIFQTLQYSKNEWEQRTQVSGEPIVVSPVTSEFDADKLLNKAKEDLKKLGIVENVIYVVPSRHVSNGYRVAVDVLNFNKFLNPEKLGKLKDKMEEIQKELENSNRGTPQEIELNKCIVKSSVKALEGIQSVLNPKSKLENRAESTLSAESEIKLTRASGSGPLR